MTTSGELGLRERKRLATRRSILTAALKVVRERGLDGATVDEISRVADISPRTFFNYFASKEEAVLGETPTLADNPEIEWFVADRGPILRGLARVVVHQSTMLLSDPELVAERRAIGKLYPELGVRRMARVHRFEEELAELALRRIRDEDADLPLDDATSRARLVALTAFAFVRHAWFSWIEHPDTSPGLAELIEQAFEHGTALMASSAESSAAASVG